MRYEYLRVLGMFTSVYVAKLLHQMLGMFTPNGYVHFIQESTMVLNIYVL